MSNTMPTDVILGVDTHKDVHAAAAISALGVRLASTTFPASSKGHQALETWATALGTVRAIGIEGTGSYGAGLSRFLNERGHAVLEVNRANRQLRRQKGKSDAESAARAVLAAMRPGPMASTMNSARTSLRALARRWLALDAEIKEHDTQLGLLTAAKAPELIKAHGVAAGTAAEMLLLVGDNPERIHPEAAFAKMGGACPIPASSGKTHRHRLNRGGNRQANAALCRVAIARMRGHQPTLDHVRRRTAEGRSKSEIIRCLKRYLAREISGYLCRPPKPATPSTETP